MKPAPGTLVTRNVKLVRPLGKGGMGSVWVGEHTTLDTEVAVKFIAPEHAEKQRFVARFRREASSAAKIKSPHVVQIFDHGVTDDDVPYIVMELLEGEPLAKRLRRGALSARETAMLVSQVCKVLSTAHELGIVHRDLKPDNLFLVESGYELFVKVLDFGIAKQLADELNEITDTGAMVGTPYYMSPEMLLSPKDADHRADLWALAVVAYHALTGALPFTGETLAALSVAINDGRFTPPSALAPQLGSEVDAWFKVALCRNLTARFSSASELAQGLRQVLMDSQDVSGDRASQDADSLPETAPVPHDGAPGLAASALTQGGADSFSSGRAEGGAPRGSTTAASVDETLTSEQLARIHAAEDVSADGDAVLEAGEIHDSGLRGESTLEGTAADGARSGAAWGRRVGLLALLVGGIAVVAVWLDRGPDPIPRAATSAEPSGLASGIPPAAPAAPTVSAVSIEPSARVPSPVASALASAPGGSEPAPPSRPRPVTLAGPPPRSPSSSPAQPSGAPKTSKPECANPFVVDENGDLQPRPGCF